MSGIVGIFNRDGCPVDPELLRRLTSRMAFWPGDGSGVWNSGCVGFGLHALWTVPEAVGETAPLVDAATGVAVVMDGRIDNREELLPELKQKCSITPEASDSAYVLWAYLVWGESFVERILGDFAIAIWDQRTGSLLCFRDRMGVRPFYYAEQAGVFVFASENAVVLDHPGVDSSLNEGMIGEFLCGAFYSYTETLIKGVSRLRRGTAMTVERDRTACREYWKPSLLETPFRSDGDAAEGLLFELRRAVRCRLRATGPVGCHLSGGLDSSTLSALAAEMQPVGGVRLFSLTFPGMKCDESYYVDRVAEMLGIGVSKVPFVPIETGYFAERAEQYQDFPGEPNGNALNHTLRMMQMRQGVRVVLSGVGGNQVLEGEQAFLTDLLRQFRFISFMRQARHYQRFSRGWVPFLRATCQPLVPGFGALRAARRTRRGAATYSFLLLAFTERIRLWEREPDLPDWRTFGSFGRRDFVRIIFSPFESFVHETNVRGAREHGVEERMPFLDSRVVQFCIGLPERLRQDKRIYKIVLRLAMDGRLPPCVLKRRVQAEFSAPYNANIRAAAPFAAELLRPYVAPEICNILEKDPLLLTAPPYGLPNSLVWKYLGIATWIKQTSS